MPATRGPRRRTHRAEVRRRTGSGVCPASRLRWILPFCLLVSPGCVPLLPIASAALSALEGGPKTTLSGPFSGNPSSVLNRNPVDPAIGEALAQSEKRAVMEVCRAQLPSPKSPAPPAAATGCAVRAICLPGGTAPVRLRVCRQMPGSELAATPPEASPPQSDSGRLSLWVAGKG